MRETEALLVDVAQLRNAVRQDKTLDHRERARVLNDLTPMLTHLHKITGAALLMSEDKVMRLPSWRRIYEAIEQVLRKHPAALSDFRAAMHALRREESAA